MSFLRSKFVFRKLIFFWIIFISMGFIGCTTYHTETETLEDYLQEVTKPNSGKPTLGIALSGGGSKAAPFAMGVLKQFVDRGWLNDVDIISSVSGGAYSTYYLYNKAIYLENKNLENKKSGLAQIELGVFFENCELDKLNEAGSLEDYNDMKVRECSGYGLFQQHVKKYQDLLSFFPSEIDRDASYFDNVQAVGIATLGLTSSILLAPFHHVANTAFDWKVELSPTQWKYKHGLDRAYRDTYDETINSAMSDQSFEDLEKITRKRKGSLPLWINNASTFEKNWFLDISAPDIRNLDESIFEITPYGFGSGREKIGYSLASPSKLSLDLSRSVLASAAFVDALQGKPILFGLLHAFNLRWGVKIPNYKTSISEQKSHLEFPWPLYYTQKGSKHTLADGGQSGDNLGLYSLIKRGVENIVIVSGSHDEENDYIKFEDICKVGNFVKAKDKKKMTITFKGMPNKIKGKIEDKEFDHTEFCKSKKFGQGDYYKKIFYSDWKRPIWEGVILDEEGIEVSKLFIIKAAFDKEDLNDNVKIFAGDKKGRLATEKYIKSYPKSLMAFWESKDYGEKANKFPQSSTFLDTLNGSQDSYQAYMDLGYYLSGFLENNKHFKEIVKGSAE
jgi:hypothetical protein